MRFRRILPALLGITLSPLAAREPSTTTIAPDSVLAVITHKAGLASGLAHDHLVAASDFDAELSFLDRRPAEASFEVEVPLARLIVDDPQLQERWYPVVEALGILEEPFGRPSAEDRTKIHEAMTGRKQLDVERYPVLAARLVSIDESPSRVGTVDHPYRLTVEISLHGTTRRETFSGRVIRDGEGRRLEALGALNTSDYGIDPYSAMLGAVKNEDRVHVLVSLAVDD